MITLYGSASSPNVLKVRLMLEEAEMPYREQRVKRETGENQSAEYLEISASGTLPAIVDDETGARVFESSAILLYLGDRSGKFYPQDPASRGDVFKWLLFDAANIGPAIENIYKLYYLDDAWVEDAIKFQKTKLRSSLGVIETRLGVAPYLAGECSIADFALLPLSNLLADFLDQPLSDYPHLERWSLAMKQRPGAQRALGV